MDVEVHQQIMNATLLGNELWRIAALFVAVFAGLLGGRIARAGLLSAAERLAKAGREGLGVALRSAASVVVFLAFCVGLRVGLTLLHLHERVRDMAETGLGVLFVVAVAWLLYGLVDAVDHWLTRVGRAKSRMDDMLVPLVRKSLRITIVVLAVLQVATMLSNKPLTSILAGLGVGGLAIALAAQDTVKNFFGSLVIFADKPFEVGERVVVDGFDGPVEEVGLRSTRIRTLEGHLVTIPNGELANKTIQNIGKRPYIRRLMNLAIPYDTPPAKVERAVQVVREVLDHHEGMQPDFPPRVFFNEFNSDSLSLLAIYWYHPPDYWKYLGFCERVNLELLRRFEQEGIEFAFPTQTLFLAGDPRRPLQTGAGEESHGARD